MIQCLSASVYAKVFSFRMPAKGELAEDEECPVDKYYRPTFIQKPPEDIKAVEGKLVRFDVKVEICCIINQQNFLNLFVPLF